MSSDAQVMDRQDLAIQTTPLGDLISIQSGYAFKSEDYTPTGHFLMRIGNVQDGEISLDNAKYVTLDSRTSPFELTEGDILTSLTGNIGRVARIENAHLPAALNQRVARLTVKDDGKLDDTYLYYALSNPDFRDKLAFDGGGAAQQNVSPKAIAGISIPLPPLDEQRRIAEVMRSVDEAIAAAEAVARQWETTFSTSLDVAFTKGEPSSLADLCSLIYRYPGFYGFNQLEEGVPVIRGEHLRSGRISTDWTDFYFVDPAFSARFPKTILQLNDVVMSVRGTVGTTAVVDASHVGSQISPNLIRLVANPAKIIPPLLFYAVQSAVAHMRRTIVNAQALPAINAGDLKRVEIALPPMHQQTELLAQLNGAAEAKAQAVAAVRQVSETKTILMSDLLSGRVRVPA